MQQDLVELMTVADVAKYLRIPASSVYKLAQEGALPALKVGRHWRFPRAMLADWVAAQTRLRPNPDNSIEQPKPVNDAGCEDVKE